LKRILRSIDSGIKWQRHNTRGLQKRTALELGVPVLLGALEHRFVAKEQNRHDAIR
jgi:hypothetical protein